ncbi:MAG: atpC [Rhodoglobus sp.]|nr:atpC [Rhodoglobus sp.]
MADDESQTAATDITETEKVATSNGKPTMAVKIYAPFQVYFEGEARSLSAVNATGPFDILPHHHNFLCMLVPGVITVQTLDGSKDIKVNRALMHVKSDKVSVFVDV